MENVESQGTASSSLTAGTRLRQARETAGLSRSDIATRTKIAERHLLAIEEDRFSELAARTYAVGFSRAYARALDLDEREIAEQVRRQLEAEENAHVEPAEPSFEPGDPARVPPVRMAWVAAAGVVLVVALLLAFWGNFLSPEGKLPDLVAEREAAPKGPAPAPAPSATQAIAANAPVVMTATAERVWVKVTDASGKQLLQKELSLGESWTVPQDAEGPQLRTGRPDALRFTVGGRPAPALSDKPATVSGVSLAAADLLASGSAGSNDQAAPAAAPAPVASPAAPPAAMRSAPAPAPGRANGGEPIAARPSASSPRPQATRAPAAAPSAGPAIAAAENLPSAPEASPVADPASQPVSTVSE
jgi:cytoskeleton protein RodZ